MGPARSEARSSVVPESPVATTFVLVPSASTVHYHLVHPLHRVHGRSSALKAGAILREDGTLTAGAIVPTTSFRSGDADRDARILEIVGAQVIFRGEVRLGRLDPAVTARIALEGHLTLNRVRRPVSVPLEVEPGTDGGARVRGSFEVSLEAHAIERPSLLLLKVEDSCRIELDLTFAAGG